MNRRRFLTGAVAAAATTALVPVGAGKVWKWEPVLDPRPRPDHIRFAIEQYNAWGYGLEQGARRYGTYNWVRDRVC